MKNLGNLRLIVKCLCVILYLSLEYLSLEYSSFFEDYPYLANTIIFFLKGLKNLIEH
jgi:hypothetical protein